MLNAISVVLGADAAGGRALAAQSFEQQGFVHAGSFVWNDGVLDAWRHPAQADSEQNACLQTADGFACCVGPLWYRSHFGRAALDILLDEVKDGFRPDECELRGNFALFLHRGDQTVLANDALGFVRIYASADHSFYATSWLAACAYARTAELNEAAAAEYVLLGASHSTETVAQGISTLPLGKFFDLTRKCAVARFPSIHWMQFDVPASYDAAVTAAELLLRAVFNGNAAVFGGSIRAALSGGFDSRLILSGMLASGVEPSLFVYGGPDSADVRVARSVAESVGLEITSIDKRQLARKFQPVGIERAVRNTLFFDGLPNDGILDAGVDEQTRLQQLGDGCLVLNGGGGEIFRNFFHLPDRRLRAIDVVNSFYRSFDRRTFRRSNGLRDYARRLAISMEAVLGIPESMVGARLSREQVELLYPLFRCHYWMAVNNSVGVRHGYYATPLADFNTVKLACRLPPSWKSAGRFESSVIAALHRAAAKSRSEYGFTFIDGPDRRARWNELAACARPIRVRPLVNAAHRALRHLGVPPDTIAHWRALLPGEWRIDPVLDLDRLPNVEAFGRALAIEVVWRNVFDGASTRVIVQK